MCCPTGALALRGHHRGPETSSFPTRHISILRLFNWLISIKHTLRRYYYHCGCDVFESSIKRAGNAFTRFFFASSFAADRKESGCSLHVSVSRLGSTQNRSAPCSLLTTIRLTSSYPFCELRFCSVLTFKSAFIMCNYYRVCCALHPCGQGAAQTRLVASVGESHPARQLVCALNEDRGARKSLYLVRQLQRSHL